MREVRVREVAAGNLKADRYAAGQLPLPHPQVCACEWALWELTAVMSSRTCAL